MCVCVCVCVSPEYIKEAKGKQEERIRKGLVEKPDTMRRVVMLLSGSQYKDKGMMFEEKP